VSDRQQKRSISAGEMYSVICLGLNSATELVEVWRGTATEPLERPDSGV